MDELKEQTVATSAAGDVPDPVQDAEVQEAIDSMIGDCTKEADVLSCALETIKTIPKEVGGCRPEILLITQDSCNYCDGHREMLKPEIATGQVRELNIDHSAEAVNIMVRNGLDMTPSLLIVDCEGKLIHEIFVEPIRNK